MTAPSAGLLTATVKALCDELLISRAAALLVMRDDVREREKRYLQLLDEFRACLCGSPDEAQTVREFLQATCDGLCLGHQAADALAQQQTNLIA